MFLLKKEHVLVVRIISLDFFFYLYIFHTLFGRLSNRSIDSATGFHVVHKNHIILYYTLLNIYKHIFLYIDYVLWYDVICKCVCVWCFCVWMESAFVLFHCVVWNDWSYLLLLLSLKFILKKKMDKNSILDSWGKSWGLFLNLKILDLGSHSIISHIFYFQIFLDY